MFKLFNNLNLGYKINLGFAALVLVLLLIVALIFNAGSAATDKINLTVDVRVPTTLAATGAQSNLLQMQAAVRGYLAVGDLQNIDDYNQAKTLFQENLAQLKELSNDWTNAEEIDRLDRLIETFAAWLPIPDKLFALHDSPLDNQPALALETIEIQPRITALLAAVDLLMSDLQALPTQTDTRNVLAELISFRTSLEGMSTNLSAYAATGNLIFKFRYSDELVTNSERFGTILTLAESAPFDITLRRTVADIVTQRTEILGLSNQVFDAVEGEQSYLDLYSFKTQMVPETEEMLALLESLAVGQRGLLQSELNDGKRSLAGLRYQTFLGGVMVMLLGLAMVYIFRRNIAKPIHRLSRTAERIGSGDLHARATVETDDEIGHLATTFNRMTDELSETFQALGQAKETAETADRAKSKFLASMSHELRTPLNAILGYVQILRRNNTLDPQQQNGLNVIQRNGEHLLGFINDILDLSKIETQKLELLPRQITLSTFLHEITQVYQSRAAEAPAVRFVTAISPKLPTTIEADEMRLRQILLNLLENAFKFTPRGTITLTVDQVAAHHAQGLADLRFVVADTGIGMTEEERATIFRPFEQLGDAQQRAKGSGLGLAITQELVYAMDADLTVESASNTGSTFTFENRFPAAWKDFEADSTIDAAPRKTEQHPKDRAISLLRGERPLRNGKISDGRVGAPAISSQSGHRQNGASSIDLAPPPAELSIMLDMALKGELPKLQTRVDQLAAQQPSYGPFVASISKLIAAYEEEQLVELLRDYCGERG